MVDLCFYFQVHQPFRLRKYKVFDINHNHQYFDKEKNKQVLNKVAKKCYLPTNKLFLELIKKHPQLKISFSFSGVVLEQFEKYNPQVLKSFQDLVDTGQVELLDETYHHSLAFLYSKKEFQEQIKLHHRKIKDLFSFKPTVFRNTELIYNNELSSFIKKLGYKGILAEGWDPLLGWKSPNFVYQSPSRLPLLLKNYKLSDDIAFRFGNQGWKEHPLTVEKFTHWVNSHNGNGNIINLFMDYETFGEHQWADTGIFLFLKKLPSKILHHQDNNFITPSQAIKKYPPRDIVDAPHPVSWADLERDLSAWNGNQIQKTALQNLYQLEKFIKSSANKKLLEDWRRLQTSDHFYYMCTKYFNDGDVHKYFNPYDNPYDAYIIMMNIINDLRTRINKRNQKEVLKNGQEIYLPQVQQEV